MPRQHRRFNDPLAEARSAVGQLTDSPLDPIALELNRALEAVTQANSRSEVAGAELARVASYVTEIVRFLPRTYGNRFEFDAGLIHAMSRDWSGEALFSRMMIPCYETQWGYTRLPMPLTEFWAIQNLVAVKNILRSDSGVGRTERGQSGLL
jgi:hypothetical protein